MTSFHRQRLTCGVLAAALLVSAAGCEAPGALQQPSGTSPQAGARPLTPAEQLMRQDQARFNKTVFDGVLTGAVIGAAIGGLGTILAGGNRKEATKNAAIGGVVGGVAGGVDGYVTAKKEQAGRDDIRALQSTTADVRADSAKLQAFLDSSSTVLAEGKVRLAALKGDVAAKRMSAEQADAARRAEEQNIALMNNSLATAKKTRDQYTQASTQFSSTPQNKRDFDAEIARMNRQVAQLESNVNDYNRALAVSKA